MKAFAWLGDELKREPQERIPEKFVEIHNTHLTLQVVVPDGFEDESNALAKSSKNGCYTQGFTSRRCRREGCKEMQTILECGAVLLSIACHFKTIHSRGGGESRCALSQVGEGGHAAR